MEELNVTEVPEQIVLPTDELMPIVGNTLLMIIAMVLLFTVAGLGHAALEVSEQLTASPFARLEVVNVEAFVPAATPFTFHW